MAIQILLKIDFSFRPFREWFNRFEHQSIQVNKLYMLNDSQKLVIYDQSSNKSQVNRRLIQGPIVFMPKENEWIHQFKWSNEDQTNLGHITNLSNSFEILSTKPELLHYNVNIELVDVFVVVVDYLR